MSTQSTAAQNITIMLRKPSARDEIHKRKFGWRTQSSQRDGVLLAKHVFNNHAAPKKSLIAIHAVSLGQKAKRLELQDALCLTKTTGL